jgi:SAM-dependent methyltransferase
VNTQDSLNQSTWSKASSRQWLDNFQSFTDEGERKALDRIGDEILGKPILDIGVGTGRTIPLLSGRTYRADYHAIDYLPSMVDTARARFPDVKIDVGDARTLDGIPHDHFGLVNFSFSGIDAVSSRDRKKVFDAVLRVLRPGGIFFFSTLNLDGPQYRERPWHLHLSVDGNPLRTGKRALKEVGSAGIDLWNWLRIRRSSEVGDGYAVAPLRAHHYGVMTHFTTLARQLDELTAAGFAPHPEIYDNEAGRAVALGDDVSRVDWFHFLARRPAAPVARS